jgi:hypothetical protein
MGASLDLGAHNIAMRRENKLNSTNLPDEADVPKVSRLIKTW